MKVLVTGSSGLVGSHFVENYNGVFKILSPKREELDITNQKSVENFFKLHKPHAVIHFAAFTDVSKAEQQRNNKKASCWIINVEGTSNLFRIASRNKIYFVHISTDVVFSGRKDNPGPYPEDFPTEEDPNLLSWYGWTKRKAEQIIKNRLENSAILRIANPVRARYNNKLDYVRKILKQFDENKLYPMFDDQYLTLTYIDEITKALTVLLEKRLSGIYHVSSVDLFTPYQLASFLIAKARGKRGVVKSISIEKFLKAKPSRYPQYGGLKVENTQKQLNLKLNRWKETITSIVKQLSV